MRLVCVIVVEVRLMGMVVVQVKKPHMASRTHRVSMCTK